MVRVLVTGATGLIGRHVLDALTARGAAITASSRSAPRIDPGRDWRRVDLADLDASAALVAGHEIVIHCAGEIAPGPVLARDPVGPLRRNLAITGNMHEACWRAGVRKLIWFSSTTGYPVDLTEIDEDAMFHGNPTDGWYGLGWAHRYLETQSRMYAEKLAPAMDVIALRPSLVYGPRDAGGDHFVYAFARQVVTRSQPLVVRGDGARDLIHARDVARAAVLAAEKVSGYRAYNIAAGTPVTTRQVLDLMLALEGWQADVRHEAPRGPGPATARRFLTERAERELGFRPEVGLEQGLGELLAHTRRQLEFAA